MRLTPEHNVTIVREIAASAEALDAAWTELAIMRTWLAEVVEADARVGGAYRIEHQDGGTIDVHRGQNLAPEPGKRIVLTFRHDAAEPGAMGDESVEVLLRPLGATLTELTLTNGWNGLGMSGEESAALTEGRSFWRAMLEDAVVHGKPSFQTSVGRSHPKANRNTIMAATHSVKVDTKGRLVIPRPLREALGIAPGDTMFVETEGDHVLRYAKAENPFDVLAEHALEEHAAGRTRSLRANAVERNVDLEAE